jgi:hypothetical protein
MQQLYGILALQAELRKDWKTAAAYWGQCRDTYGVVHQPERKAIDERIEYCKEKLQPK